MDTTYEVLRNIHIVCGAILLLLGILQISMPKRGRRHKNLGLAYFVFMWIVGLSAILISVMRMLTDKNFNSLFLLCIGLFSIYMASSGRLLARHKNEKVNSGMQLLPFLGMMIGTGLLILTLRLFILEQFGAALICLVFGSIQTLLAISDFMYFIRDRRSARYGKNSWLFLHLGRMIGSFIAASTAFLVNAVEVGPAWIKWLGPTILGTVLIVAFSRYYHRKLHDSNSSVL